MVEKTAKQTVEARKNFLARTLKTDSNEKLVTEREPIQRGVKRGEKKWCSRP